MTASVLLELVKDISVFTDGSDLYHLCVTILHEQREGYTCRQLTNENDLLYGSLQHPVPDSCLRVAGGLACLTDIILKIEFGDERTER